jgi:hypothetical protein
MMFARRLVVVLLPIASGCFEPISHQALAPEGDSPEMGPWTDCVAALTGGGRTHDPCTFGGGDGSGCSDHVVLDPNTHVATCLDGELVRSRGRRVSDPSAECVAPGTPLSATLDEEGCAYVEECNEKEDHSGWVPSMGRQVCEGPKAPRISDLEEPWDFASASGCSEFFDAHGRADDPCTGELVCVHDQRFFVAWCREGTVALAMDTPFIS